MLRQRARNPEDKLARRDAILSVASQVLSRTAFGDVTMAELAQQCGVAKGTLYLYFATKEELFLATLQDELARWFDALGQTLLATGRVTPERFAEIVVDSLDRHDRLADLLPLLHTVLEHNIAPDTALQFKRMLAAKIAVGATLVEQVMPELRPGCGTDLLLRIHALVVGLRQMADPPPSLRALLERDELAVLRVEFGAQLRGALAALAAGMCSPA
jgi:AcrR family transcriptional regulator